MNKPPQGWPRITAAVFYDDAAKAIDWLCEAFGFEVRLKIEGDGGRIEHSELEHVIVTDTIPLSNVKAQNPKITVLSVASLLGEAIARIHSNSSVSSLFV